MKDLKLKIAMARLVEENTALKVRVAENAKFAQFDKDSELAGVYSKFADKLLMRIILADFETVAEVKAEAQKIREEMKILCDEHNSKMVDTLNLIEGE